MTFETKVQIGYCEVTNKIWARIRQPFVINVQLSEDRVEAYGQFKFMCNNYTKEKWSEIIRFHIPSHMARDIYEKNLVFIESRQNVLYILRIQNAPEGWLNWDINTQCYQYNSGLTHQEVLEYYLAQNEHVMIIDGYEEHYKPFTSRETAEEFKNSILNK